MIKEQFYWSCITEAIRMYCRRCEQSQLLKADTWKVTGLHQPLVLKTPWEQTHIDFVTELPEDNWYGTIMMCMDQFRKMVVLVPLGEMEA